MRYLNRHVSGLPDEIWDKIDETVIATARDALTGRRFLELDGAYGVGLTAVEIGADDYCTQVGEEEAGAVLSKAISVPMLRKSCKLSLRRVEAYMNMGQPLNLAPVQDAAEAVARREEAFIYYGHKDFALDGLMTAEGSHDVPAGSWHQLEQALEDVLSAVNLLDQSGFHGPYALAMSPALYNNLFRRYEGTDMLQLEHLQRLCESGLYKAPIEGAVVVDPHVGELVVGQDIMTGFSANDGIHYQLFVAESLVFRLHEPQAVCTLKPEGG